MVYDVNRPRYVAVRSVVVICKNTRKLNHAAQRKHKMWCSRTSKATLFQYAYHAIIRIRWVGSSSTFSMCRATMLSLDRCKTCITALKTWTLSGSDGGALLAPLASEGTEARSPCADGQPRSTFQGPRDSRSTHTELYEIVCYGSLSDE